MNSRITDAMTVKEDRKGTSMTVSRWLVRTTGFNQDGTEVAKFRRPAMIYRRGQGPHSTKIPVA
jgi:hypothetical protein